MPDSTGSATTKAEERLVAIGDISLLTGHGAAQAIVLKKDAEADRQLTMFVGQAEFAAVAKEKGLAGPARPFTHELYLAIIDKLPVRFLRVEVFALREDTYYAKVIFRFNGTEYAVDSRPSDAIALALNRRIPIMVNEDLLSPLVSQDNIEEYQGFIKRAKF